jgi:hypothetical protein
MELEEVRNDGMVFENVIEHFLIAARPGTTYWANYFNDQFRSRALLFAVCAKESSINAENYTLEERDRIDYFSSHLDDIFTDNDPAVEKNSREIFYECLLFFANKMNP